MKNQNINIRDVVPSDYKEILRLNHESVHFLSPMTLEKLEDLVKESDLLWIAEIDGEVGAFIIAFREGAQYDSVNYQWFEKNYENFLYIDRIVVDINSRKKGLGEIIYDKLFEYGKNSSVDIITAEIDIEPENPISLKFHQKYGFVEVGRQEVAGGSKIVSLQASKL